MSTPTVSFVIPCYKLGHLVAECVNSILAQSYSHFEILIMDDCSPDNTSEVAKTITDSRVRYIRNEQNLGHLNNYNKGIKLSRGQYVWLISADDRLRVPYVLERYVNLLEQHPEVGYVFCPGIGLQSSGETELLETFYYGAKDTIFKGTEFIATVLRKGGGLLSPSVMVRKLCYEQLSMFPLDMPHQGDLYLWFLWALHYDVAYLAEPMVNYRSHDANMMKDFMTRSPKTIFVDESNVLWRIKREAERKGFHKLALFMEPFISGKYAHGAGVILFNETCVPWGMTVEDCDEALRSNSASTQEYRRLRSKFFAYVGDKYWHRSKFQKAREYYRKALREDRKALRIMAKLLAAYLGPLGAALRAAAKFIVRWVLAFAPREARQLPVAGE